MTANTPPLPAKGGSYTRDAKGKLAPATPPSTGDETPVETPKQETGK